MAVVLENAGGGDVDLGDGARVSKGHLVAKEKTGGTKIRFLVSDRGVI